MPLFVKIRSWKPLLLLGFTCVKNLSAFLAYLDWTFLMFYMIMNAFTSKRSKMNLLITLAWMFYINRVACVEWWKTFKKTSGIVLKNYKKVVFMNRIYEVFQNLGLFSFLQRYTIRMFCLVFSRIFQNQNRIWNKVI